MPTGKPEHLDPAYIANGAKAIMEHAVAAARIILKARDDLDRTGKAKTPLVVVVGEDHPIVAQRAPHYMALLKEIGKSGESGVFCYELEHDFPDRKFEAVTGSAQDTATKKEMRAKNRDGSLSLKSYLAFGNKGMNYADYSRAVLFHFLLRHQIPTCFTDASFNGDWLNHRDRTTAQSLKSHGLKGFVNDLSANGMKVRNHHMARLALEFGRAHEARIIIQQCGNSHALGNAGKKFAAGYSLSAAFKKHSAPVIAIPSFSAGFDRESLPGDHARYADIVLPAGGLPETEALYDAATGRPLWQGSDICYRDDEAAFVNGLVKNMKMTGETLPLAAYERHKQRYQKEMSGFFMKKALIS